MYRKETKFKTFKKQMRDKARPARRNSDQQVSVQRPTGTSAESLDSIKAGLSIDAEYVAEDGKRISGELKKFPCWSQASNDDIETAMGKIDGWKKGLSRLKDKVFAMKKMVAKYSLDESSIATSVAVMKTLETEMDIAVKAIEMEVDNRCLYSTSKSKASNIKFHLLEEMMMRTIFDLRRISIVV